MTDQKLHRGNLRELVEYYQGRLALEECPFCWCSTTTMEIVPGPGGKDEYRVFCANPACQAAGPGRKSADAANSAWAIRGKNPAASFRHMQNANLTIATLRHRIRELEDALGILPAAQLPVEDGPTVTDLTQGERSEDHDRSSTDKS